MSDGGPVYPNTHGMSPQKGMSLRDYFAIHSDQPGETEIMTAAGVSVAEDRHLVTEAGNTVGRSFSDWWHKLSNETRFMLSSKVRYQQADAMLKARES